MNRGTTISRYGRWMTESNDATDKSGTGRKGGLPGCLIYLVVLTPVFVIRAIDKAFGSVWLERLGGVLIVVPLIFFAVALLIAAAFILAGRRAGPALLRIPGALLVAYGAVGFLLPAVGSMVLPRSWQWPVTAEMKALTLDDGAFTVQANGGRVQIYNRDGSYRTGWFVPSGGKSFAMNYVPGSGLRVLTGSEFLVYDLEGKVVLSQRANLRNRPGFQDGPYETRRMDSSWWLLPLAETFCFVPTVAGGALLLAVSYWLGRRRYPPEDDGVASDGHL